MTTRRPFNLYLFVFDFFGIERGKFLSSEKTMQFQPLENNLGHINGYTFDPAFFSLSYVYRVCGFYDY
ncbi:hypothetical protein QVD17_06803 [Tagetes erecta]|uniref:Uncharacterized protein n=1 Tax=Tagetes erecta TaxID=13708 RepID=A0AAD8LGN6_TARER|nr:hypothetical protein QVD17_06803 [Tagetes erecta]